MQKKRFFRFNDTRGDYHARPRFLDFHLMAPLASFEYPGHCHAVHEVIIVLEGAYQCALNGEDLLLESGSLLIVEPGDIHQDHLRRRQRHYVFHFCFPDESMRLFASGIPMRDRICAAGHWDASYFCRWMENESASFEGTDPVSATLSEHPDALARVQDALMEAFFWELVRRYPNRSLSPEFREEKARHFFVSRLYRSFADHCRSDFPVEMMVDELRVSRRTLTENCARWLGSPPARAFLAFRLEAASRELSASGKTVREVSDFFGFDNQFQFSRAFKRVYGISPGSLRQ